MEAGVVRKLLPEFRSPARVWHYGDRPIFVSRAITSLLLGAVLGLLTFRLGVLLLPVLVAALLLPWFLQDPFRLFLLLIVTWPVLTLYARIPLPAGIPDLSYERILILLTFGIILVEGLLRKRKLSRVGILDILVLMYVIMQLRSHILMSWFGGGRGSDLNGFLEVILLLLMYWMAKNLLTTTWHLKWLLYSIIVASVIVCLTGLYEQALGTPQSPFPINDSLPHGMRFMDVPGGRAAGVVVNPAIYGGVMGLGTLASLCCLAHVQDKTRAILTATIFLLLYGLFASYTRSAWISSGITLLVGSFFVKDLWKRTLPISILSVLAVISKWSDLAENPIVARRLLSTRNLVYRDKLAEVAWYQFSKRPLQGWGAGALDAFTWVQLRDGSHNTFLTLLVDGGLLLFLGFLVLCLCVLLMSIRAYKLMQRDSLERHVLTAMVGSIVIYLMSGMALELRHFTYFGALFWIAVGTIDAVRAMAKKQVHLPEVVSIPGQRGRPNNLMAYQRG